MLLAYTNRLCLTLPVTRATTERSSLKLKLVKTATFHNDGSRISSLLTLSIEREKVIGAFAINIPRRLPGFLSTN